MSCPYNIVAFRYSIRLANLIPYNNKIAYHYPAHHERTKEIKMENNKTLTVVLSIILALATAGCTPKKSYQVRPDCYAAMKAYVAVHKEYNGFLLLSTQKLFNEDGTHPGFLIGPLYKGLDKELKDFAPTEFLEIDGRKVYLFSEVSYLLNNDHIPISDYFKPDSILILSYGQQRIYNHNRLINYLKRAKLLYFEQGKLRISNSPDTLYLPVIKIDSPVRSEGDR